MDKPIAIEVTKLVKSFGTVKAVNGIDLTAKRGDIIALLGPNGAGKTTSINLLSTQLKPDSGVIRILDIDAVSKPKSIRKKIAVTFQETSLDLELTGRQILTFSGELYGMSRKRISAKAGELLEIVELTDVAKRKVKTYSGGMKRRLELARSLMHTPEVLILDEPTLGLDPQTRQKIWKYILDLKKEQSMTIIITTHYLDEAEKLSDYVYIIDKGVVVSEGKADELIASLGADSIRLRGEGPTEEIISKLKKLKYVGFIHEGNNNTLLIGLDSGQKRCSDIVKIALDIGYTIHEIEIVKPDLGDVFFKATGNEIRK